MSRTGHVAYLIAVATVILAVLALAPRGARASADWRPPHADTLAALDAEMAPTLAAFKPSLDLMLRDSAAATEFVSFTDPDAVIAETQARLDAARRTKADIAALLTLAVQGVAILDRHPPDPCWRAYWAAEMVGWLSLGDSTQSVAAGDLGDANKGLGVASYLLGDYGDLLHAAALVDCA